MEEESDKPAEGVAALFSKTLLVLYTSLLAFTGARAAGPQPAAAERPIPDPDFIARLTKVARRPQLVLKLNLSNPVASKSLMHTSHRSHSSHSSHYSSSSSGHSSHVSHSSHYSSSSYGGSGSSSSYYTTPATPTYPPRTTPAYSPKPTRRRAAARVPSYVSADPAANSYSLSLGDRVLKLGDRGSDVQELQVLLVAQGYDLTADGSFGLGTNAAVKSFQLSHRLPTDGVVGAQTIMTLRGY